MYRSAGLADGNISGWRTRYGYGAISSDRYILCKNQQHEATCDVTIFPDETCKVGLRLLEVLREIKSIHFIFHLHHI